MNTLIDIIFIVLIAVSVYLIGAIISYRVIIRTIDLECVWDVSWAAKEVLAKTLFWPLTLILGMALTFSSKIAAPIYDKIDNCWEKFQQAITKKIKADVERKMNTYE